MKIHTSFYSSKYRYILTTKSIKNIIKHTSKLDKSIKITQKIIKQTPPKQQHDPSTIHPILRSRNVSDRRRGKICTFCIIPQIGFGPHPPPTHPPTHCIHPRQQLLHPRGCIIYKGMPEGRAVRGMPGFRSSFFCSPSRIHPIPCPIPSRVPSHPYPFPSHPVLPSAQHTQGIASVHPSWGSWPNFNPGRYLPFRSVHMRFCIMNIMYFKSILWMWYFGNGSELIWIYNSLSYANDSLSFIARDS